MKLRFDKERAKKLGIVLGSTFASLYLLFLILPFIQDEVEKLLGKKVVTFTNMFIQNLICLLFIYLFGLTYKTVILLVFYGKFEVFHDILFFSSLVDFLVDSGLTVIITLMMIKLRNYHLNN